MMDDLISRQYLIEAFKDEFFGMYSDDFNYMIKWFKGLPAADSSEFCDQLWKIAYEHGKRDAQPIRCDECKHWDTEWIPAIGEGHYCPMIDHVMVGDEWCCYGKRKSDG